MAREMIIRASNVAKEFNIGNQIILALKSLSLDVAENEFVSIEGPSGAGKTTLLNIVGGIDSPTSGEMWVFNQNLAYRDEEFLAVFRCANIGFVFQNYNLISTLTAGENITFPMELGGWDKNHIQGRTENLLEMVGLADRANHFPSQLSGGEQQRAAFARALANDPPVLLVDEPTANLDKKTGSKIVNLLQTWKRRKTILVATHDERIVGLADQKLHMEDGSLLR